MVKRFSAILSAMLLVLFSASSNAETNVCNAGIGGTGISQDGIGGTGAQVEGIGGTGIQANSGIGGTGKQAEGIGGTGIVGIITGFASICVNGLEVHYDNQTQVDVDGLTSDANALDIGQLVAIESVGKANQLVAKRVSVSHIIVGKIEKVDAALNSIQIMGKPVYLSQNTINGSNLKLNQTVKVSGLVAANNAVHALRIDLAAADTPSQVAGLIDANNAVNGIRIADTNSAASDEIVRVSGRWDGRVLHASKVKESALQRVLNKADNLVIQGIAPANAEQTFVLQNQTVKTDSKTKISGSRGNSNQTIIVYGKADRAGKINARHIEYSSENKVLERGGSKLRPESNNKPNSLNERSKHEGEASSKENKDRLDRLETAERPEKVERVESVERPEMVERPEKIEHLEKIERPERHEAHETK